MTSAPSGMKSWSLLPILLILIHFAHGWADPVLIDERFTVDEDSVITDTATGLLWRTGPDTDTGWEAANLWIDGLEGEWRMPFRYELLTLWDVGIDTDSWGPFVNSGYYVWCIDSRTSPEKHLFSFIPEDPYWWEVVTDYTGERAFAVLAPEERVLLGSGSQVTVN